jgi:hypothetical protein
MHRFNAVWHCAVCVFLKLTCAPILIKNLLIDADVRAVVTVERVVEIHQGTKMAATYAGAAYFSEDPRKGIVRIAIIRKLMW